MILSSVVLPDASGFPPRALCFRSDAPDIAALSRGDIVRFDTYFGSLSLAKWRAYTRAEQYALVISARGKLKIVLFAGTVRVSETAHDFGGGGEARFVLPDADDIAFFTIEALSSRAAFLSAHYEAKVEAEPVRLALNICTFRREAYVKDNMRALEGHLPSGVDALIIDNGQTLSEDMLPAFAHLYYNENTGGSGGFARGMAEAARGAYTHVAMMDDDVRVHPEAIKRLYALLSCLKEQYQDRPVAGAMLRLDANLCLQHESGGLWRETRTEAVKGNLDLSTFENVQYNEVEEPIDYGAWWFCCVPMREVERVGPPMPFFIRFDDVEYGLRMKAPLTLNGICVWHAPFEGKYSAALEYYSARNGLYVNARHRRFFSRAHAKKWLIQLYLGNIFRYRYDHFELILKGVEDFCRGNLMSLSPEAVHIKILTMVPPLSESFERPAWADAPQHRRDTPITKLISLVTLNGMLLPLSGEAAVPAYQNAVISHFRKRRVYNVIEGTQDGFWVECDRHRAWTLFKRLLAALKRLDDARFGPLDS